MTLGEAREEIEKLINIYGNDYETMRNEDSLRCLLL